MAEAQRESDEARNDSPLDQGDAATTETSAEDGQGSQNGALGIASDEPRESFSSTRAEVDTKESDLAPMPPAIHHVPATVGAGARSLAAVFIPPPPPADDSSAPKSATEPSRPPKSLERGLSAGDVTIAKPGGLRLKPKQATASIRSGSPASLQLAPNSLETEIDSAVIPPTPAEFGAIGRNTQSMLSVSGSQSSHGHNKGLTASSSASTTDDMILSPPGTPSGDRMSVAGSEEGIARRHSADVSMSKEVSMEGKKASRLSTGTTAFGPM